MGNYHSRIMNIQTSGKEKQSSSEWSYKTGHRDARHAAAEIALEAEREIEELKSELEYYYKLIDVLQDLPIDVDELLED